MCLGVVGVSGIECILLGSIDLIGGMCLGLLLFLSTIVDCVI